ncbi:hypothetical protein [Mesorhizobium sp. M0228]|uniref:hypothetical protein n=1 Tax=Mesorhizobium sp. M0228 TaxID=2956923 RepID=UPI003338CD5E
MLCLLSGLAAMLASAVALIIAVQDPTRTIAAEQLVFSVPLLLLLAGSIRIGPASSTMGSRARCWPAPLRRLGGRGYGSA